jgi:hypothetical protein
MKNITYNETKISTQKFIQIQKNNTKIETNKIFINPTEYITTWRYNEMQTRWNQFIKNKGHKPSYIYIKPPATDISGDDKIIPITTYLDMEKRVQQYQKNGGKITDTRRIYLKYDEQLEYITYTKFKDLQERCNQWRKTKGKNPNYLYIISQSNTNKKRPQAVGDNIQPNQNGWYLSQRYKTQPNAIKQENNHYCGPNAIQQLFYEISGKWYSENKIAKIAGTTQNGTDHQGINKAITTLAKENNLKITITWKYFSDIGYKQLAQIVKDIKTGSLQHLHYKNKYGHYEEILGVNNKTGKLLIANSLSGGWLEYRNQTTNTQWLNGITQPSICEVKIL